MSIAERPSAPAVARDLDALRAQLSDAHEATDLRPLGLGDVLLGAGALAQLTEVVTELRRTGGDVVVLADTRPMEGPHGELKAGVVGALGGAGLPVRRVTIGDAHAVTHADAVTIETAARATDGADVLVSVGSGTVADVGKALSARATALAHVIVQTAASINGFADDQAVLLVDGVKRTMQAQWPDVLLIDTDVISRAPAELNRAGLGDLLASYTAPADWLLARLVGQDDRYSPAAVALVRSYVDPVLEGAAGIGEGDPVALENLAGALTLGGISMGVAGVTAPGSGMEHTVSHLIEMAERPGELGALHGAKVGALSVLATMLWARVRAVVRSGGLARLRFPDEGTMRERVLAAFVEVDPSGRMGEECWREYARKLDRWDAARERLWAVAPQWPAFDLALDGVLAEPERLVGALRAAGAPCRLRQLGIPDQTVRWALANCHLMRDRFTVADLAFFLGIWDEHEVQRLLDAAAELGAGL
jgi:glycerol-1-phosphate dehydrogenase [NAD(P)+]